jgi:hypothetical protein
VVAQEVLSKFSGALKKILVGYPSQKKTAQNDVQLKLR